MSRQLWEVAETKISAGLSRVMGPAELIEMVLTVVKTQRNPNPREQHSHTPREVDLKYQMFGT
jgi:hypothetical protein